jgi:hypothetical protein
MGHFRFNRRRGKFGVGARQIKKEGARPSVGLEEHAVPGVIRDRRVHAKENVGAKAEAKLSP